MVENGNAAKSFKIIMSYVPLAIIGFGVVGNTTSFLIYTFSARLNKYSSMIFLSFIAVFNTTGLFIWNLNHFLDANFGIWLEGIDLVHCKSLTYIQYTSLQISGLLYSIISVDRFFTVIAKPGSVYKKLPFGTRKSAYVWSVGIIVTVCLVNLHAILANGVYRYVKSDSSQNMSDNSSAADSYSYVECYVSELYDFAAVATYTQFTLYTIIPFIIMSIFNALLIKNTFYNKRNYVASSNAGKTEKKNLRITLSLVILTITFLVMTVPGTITNGLFFYEINSTYIGASMSILLDCFMFLQQTMIFLISCLTNRTFLRIIKEKVFCCLNKNKESKSATS